jgi:hypothetical protein
MMKSTFTLLVFLLSTVLFLPTLVQAVDKELTPEGKVPGQPFDYLQQQIDGLQNQINNIPAGPAGPTGPAGPQGDPGTITDNSIFTNHILDGQVTADDIATGLLPGVNADLIDGLHASDIIDAASQDTRIPISSVPFLIAQPGSYIFTDNLTLASGSSAISVQANNVTIDLNGFSLIGPGATSGLTTNGIAMSNFSNVEIRNGTVTDFPGVGILENTPLAKGHRIINMRVHTNGSNGIQVNGSDHLVKGCRVYSNGGYGIGGSTSDTLVTENLVSDNGTEGIIINSGSVLNNEVFRNGTNGIRAGGKIVGNHVALNGGRGIYGGTGTMVKNNTSILNALSGIHASGGSSITGNLVHDNNLNEDPGEAGILVSFSTFVKGNSVSASRIQNMVVNFNQNSIEGNYLNNSPIGINFIGGTNYYSNNRSTNTPSDFTGSVPMGSLDGGGNIGF